MSSDIIGDMITIINNGLLRSKKNVLINYSRYKHMIAECLNRERYIDKVEVVESENKKYLSISLRYYNNKNRIGPIEKMSRVSKPSVRYYRTSNEVGYICKNYYYSSIFSTSKGVMSGRECIKNKIGGEELFRIR